MDIEAAPFQLIPLPSPRQLSAFAADTVFSPIAAKRHQEVMGS
jgi:hypothetical protein